MQSAIGMRAGVIALAFIASNACAQSYQLGGICTAVSPPFSTGDKWYPGRLLKSGEKLVTEAGHSAATHLFGGGTLTEPMEEGTLYLDGDSTATVTREAGYSVLSVSRGTVVARYVSRDGQSLVVKAGGSWARLERGALRVALTGGQGRFSLLVEGDQATEFAGSIPADGPGKAVQNGRPVQLVAGDETAGLLLVAKLHRRLGIECVQPWLTMFEKREVDPDKANLKEIGVKPVRGTASSSRGTSFATPSAMQVVVPVTAAGSVAGIQATSGTRALLTSGSPASVLVGARLERARVVGTQGTISGLGFNNQVRSPLQLSR